MRPRAPLGASPAAPRTRAASRAPLGSAAWLGWRLGLGLGLGIGSGLGLGLGSRIGSGSGLGLGLGLGLVSEAPPGRNELPYHPAAAERGGAVAGQRGARAQLPVRVRGRGRGRGRDRS